MTDNSGKLSNEKKTELEEDLKELAETDAQGGGTPAVAISVAVSIAFCPTGKCTSKC